MTDSSRRSAERLPSTAAPAPAIVVERLGADAAPDVFEAITGMLHRAYRQQVELGLKPLAGRQDAATTRRRCSSGETYVARFADGVAPIGMILLQEIEEAAFPPWFLRPEVAHFSLFAVDPPHQRHGIGARLLRHIEARTRELGKSELALSMAEPDTALMRYYLDRGYRFIEQWQWPYTNYRSAILSRGVGGLGVVRR